MRVMYFYVLHESKPTLQNLWVVDFVQLHGAVRVLVLEAQRCECEVVELWRCRGVELWKWGGGEVVKARVEGAG